MAPTAELTETPTSEKPTTAVFMARRRALVLVRRPERTRFADSTGERIVVPGDRLQFVDGRYATSDPGELEWLRQHELFGNSESGFFEVTPEAPAPTDELRIIATAAARADAKTLQDLLETELIGWNRPLVVDSCRTALEQIAIVAAELGAPAGGTPPAPPIQE